MTDEKPAWMGRPVTDSASLEAAWRTAMGELGFGCPRVYALFLQDEVPFFMTEFDECPPAPDAETAAGFLWILRQVVEEGASVALLYARPGSATRTAGDRAWAALLRRVCPGGWPVFMATDEDLRVFAPDDLVA